MGIGRLVEVVGLVGWVGWVFGGGFFGPLVGWSGRVVGCWFWVKLGKRGLVLDRVIGYRAMAVGFYVSMCRFLGLGGGQGCLEPCWVG